MDLKNVFVAVVGVTLLAWSAFAVADEYRPDEFLGLDLSRAVLSPKPLGPPTYFAPGPLDVTVDRGGKAAVDRGGKAAQVQAERQPQPQPENVAPRIVVGKTRVVQRVVHARAEQPRGAGRTRLARRHGNPLDAQAFDTRIQVWPCRSGGICNWKR
jgi:hypothetical protein